MRLLVPRVASVDAKAVELAQFLKLEESLVTGKSKFVRTRKIQGVIEEKVSAIEENEVPPRSKKFKLQEQIGKLLTKQKEIESKLPSHNTNPEESLSAVTETNKDVDGKTLKVPLAEFEKTVLHHDFKIVGVMQLPELYNLACH